MNKFKAYNYLSEADLSQLKEWNNSIPHSNEKLFKEILFAHGADITKPIECVEDTHRMRTSNKTHTGRKWVFVERTDKEWLASGKASIEAHMASTDKEIMKDMSSMSRYAVVATKSESKEDI